MKSFNSFKILAVLRGICHFRVAILILGRFFILLIIEVEPHVKVLIRGKYLRHHEVKETPELK
jgi:hypothetical protein